MKKTLIFLFALVLCNASFAQKKNLKDADKAFEAFAYKKASKLYKEALSSGQDSTLHILSRLGDCYYFNSKVDSASFWYDKAIKRFPNIEADYIWKNVQSLRGLGDFRKANELLVEFKEKKGDASCEMDFEFVNLEKLLDTTTAEAKKIKVFNLSLNTKFSDFGGFELKDKLYFSSSRTRMVPSDEYEWNEEPFLNIFEADIQRSNGSNQFEEVSPITSVSINLDSEHEGALAITKDGNTIYFTRNNVAESERSHDIRGTSNLNLYRAIRVDKIWREVEKLDLNVENYSTGHPALSPDEKTLYFVSDRPHPDALGGTDIYKVEIYGNGRFGPVVNLGDKVNTVHREMFPFVANDSTLYFSSDGHTTGLLDIFKSDILKKTIEHERKNLGAKFNSLRDDFAFFMNGDGKSGYFSSNRAGGVGSDDIYSFIINDECIQNVTGVAYDKLTNATLNEVSVQLVDVNGAVLGTVITDASGSYSFSNIDCNSSFNLSGSKPKHDPDSKDFSSSGIPGATSKVDLYLMPLEEIKINQILFDFDKSNIRPDAARELDIIVDVMTRYPKMIIKIQSHTDSRGRDSYNRSLSDRRAKSTREYIISKGIERSRIESAIGYGETALVNRCDNANIRNCSEEEHQENRRSVFLIVNNYR